MPYYGSDGYHRDASGGGAGLCRERHIISTWSDRPLEFRKLPEPAPLEPTEAHGGNPRDMRPEDKAFFGLDGGQTLVLWGKPSHGAWGKSRLGSDTHRLTLHINGEIVTGKMEAV